MKTYTFPAWCRFGKGNSGETWVDVDLTEEEEKLLLEYGTKADIYYGDFYDCLELRELHDKVYKIAVEQMTEEILDYGDFDDDEMKEPGWKADDTYACGVNFPEELEDMIEDDEETE